MRRILPAVTALTWAAFGAGVLTGGSTAPVTVPRFAARISALEIAGPARTGRYLEASGRRAALLGNESGRFEAWVYPLKVAHGVDLAFETAAYADPIPGTSLATAVTVRPEGVIVRYAHAAFTVDAWWVVGLDQPGGSVLLDVETSVPLTVVVKFRPDLKPMWPAALGGQYSYWDDEQHAYVIGEASRKHVALIGSPFAVRPPEQPAHNLPDTPLHFRIPVTPALAASGRIPIGIAAASGGLEAARVAYRQVLAAPGDDWHVSAAHYRGLHDDLVSIDTPDDSLDLALEWGKVALDKGRVCNPDLGCGLIAGLGPSGTTERPGFGWYFGGDAFMNTWALVAAGDVETARETLAFFAAHQRADGKMPHEVSQSARWLRWFEDFPYAYYHADTTPLFISALADYVRATDDVETATRLWPAAERAFTYCLSTDEDGDGLMDNTRAGLAAVETGALRSRDVLTDVYLAGAWADAAQRFQWLARRLGKTERMEQAGTAYTRARESLNRRFAGSASAIPFAIMKDTTLQGESTVWPSLGIWRGHFAPGSPALQRTLDALAGPEVAADWGARMLGNASALYDPLSYNNGAVWPFVTGFAALALYEHGRADAAFQYTDALGQLAFLESRGYTAELFSGDRLRSVDAAVPHQLFATSGFVSALLRGLVGFDAGGPAAGDALTLRPALPAGWNTLTVRNLRWRGHRVAVRLDREATAVRLRLDVTPGPLDVVVDWRLPDGAVPDAVHVRESIKGERVVRQAVTHPGVAFAVRRAPLVAGDRSSRLRIVDVVSEGAQVVARVTGRRGAEYFVDVHGARAGSVSASGGTVRQVSQPARAVQTIALRIAEGAGDWGEARLMVESRVHGH